MEAKICNNNHFSNKMAYFFKWFFSHFIFNIFEYFLFHSKEESPIYKKLQIEGFYERLIS